MTTRTRAIKRTNKWLIMNFIVLIVLLFQSTAILGVMGDNRELTEKQLCYERAAFQLSAYPELTTEDSLKMNTFCDDPDLMPQLTPSARPGIYLKEEKSEDEVKEIR